MSLSELVVPVLLCFTACYALGKRVDVYTALTRGAEEGLNVLVHILPSLIALLTAVYMFRASGAMEYLGALLAPALERVGIPPEVAPLLFIRPISGSGALAVGSELMATYGSDSYIGRVGQPVGCPLFLYPISTRTAAAGVRNSPVRQVQSKKTEIKRLNFISFS